MSLTPTQQKVLDAVEKQGKATVASIATALEMTFDNAQRNLRFLTKTDYIHISEKDTSKPWVSLTNKELFDLWQPWLSDTEYARVIEAALRNKNT